MDTGVSQCPDPRPRLPCPFRGGKLPLVVWARMSFPPPCDPHCSPSWLLVGPLPPRWASLLNQVPTSNWVSSFPAPSGPSSPPLTGQGTCAGFSAGGRPGPLHVTGSLRWALPGALEVPRRRAASSPGKVEELGETVVWVARWSLATMDHRPTARTVGEEARGPSLLSGELARDPSTCMPVLRSQRPTLRLEGVLERSFEKGGKPSPDSAQSSSTRRWREGGLGAQPGRCPHPPRLCFSWGKTRQ